jgi:putative transposase
MSSVPESPAKARPLIQVDQAQVEKHIDEVVRDSVEATLNALLDAEADELCGAQR